VGRSIVSKSTDALRSSDLQDKDLDVTISNNQFQSPYIPNTEQNRKEMMSTIDILSSDELFADIPQEYRNPVLKLLPAVSEMELLRELGEMAAKNAVPGEYACFLGAGSYHHFIPSAVRSLASRSEFLTSYTPYQPEVSQGTLQVAYEFQSLIALLTEMDLANAGMYDGATALAEGALMACRITHRNQIVVLDTVSSRYRQVLETYTRPQGIQVTVGSTDKIDLTDDTACLVVQYPNHLGYLEDLSSFEHLAHDAGALLVVSCSPIPLGILRPPGAYGADIVTGECQPLGIPQSFGGPYLGFFTCKEQYLRQMPGRIVGRTTDTQGRIGYVLTLQTREQHIRRERATSNICTSEALVALMATVYLALVGKRGLNRLAEYCYHKAHYAASLIADVPGYRLPLSGEFFHEFVVECPTQPSVLNQRLLEEGILGGLDVSDLVPNGMLLCFTEMNSREQIDRLVAVLSNAKVSR
jgi:glycine dehydrogenase subunit 1